MPLGAHLPTSKGFPAAIEHAQTLGCDCLQIFSKSPRQWNAAPLDIEKCADFRSAWRDSGFAPLVVHDSYLINLAAPDEAVRAKSIAAMIDEVERADLLGADFLVTHCGAFIDKTDGGEARGLAQLSASLCEVLAATPEAKVRIALENTAAQGTCLGGPWEHIAEVLELLDTPRLAVCFDTCHAFAAGHQLSTVEIDRTLQAFDAAIGLKNLAVVHLNDSKGACGGHLDRHAHIGEGEIGREAMRAILTHPGLRDKPFILETPDLETNIGRNLNTVRLLRDEALVGEDEPFSETNPPSPPLAKKIK
ncbi:MAG TPA: deoxyribonuclease IV [Abditibacteriaceae bacterium]|jgi:deoxyribonuclease-4